MKKMFTYFLTAAMLLLFSAVSSPMLADNAAGELSFGSLKKAMLLSKPLNNIEAKGVKDSQKDAKVDFNGWAWTLDESTSASYKSLSGELDTIELEFDGFYEDPYYIPAEEIVTRNGDTIIVGGDWIITLMNPRYRFTFDFYGGSPESPEGTYTVDNMDVPYCLCVIPAAPNNSSYPKVCDMTIKKEQLSVSTFRYILDAVVVTTFGIGGEENGIFKIHAEHEVVIASQRYDIALYNCSLTPEDDRFNIKGEDDTVAVDLTFFTDLGVVGYYSQNLLDTENSKIIHQGTSYEVMELEGIVTSAENIYGSITYVAMMEILANSETDTTFFNVAMEAPVVPTDTIDIFCSNLILSPSQDAVVVEGSNSQYEIYAGYNDMFVRDSATYSGLNAMAYITNVETEELISAMMTTITVVGNNKKGYTVTAKVLGDDHKYYNLFLTNVLPENMDTVNVNFPANSKAMFDIDELGLVELLIANYNGDYSVSFDILHIDQIMGGEFSKSDLFIDESEVTTYFVKHTPNGDVAVDFVQFEGEIKQKHDSTFLNAMIIGFDSTVYNISMFYSVPIPTDTLEYNFPDYNTTFTNGVPSGNEGSFILESVTDDGLVLGNVQVNRTRSIEGTFICDGKFIENQFEPFNTFIGTYNSATKSYDLHYMQKGEMTVTMDENGKITAKASFICDDAKLYILTYTVQYVRAHLPFDAEEGDIDYTFGANSEIYVNDFVESDNVLFFEIVAEDYSNMVSLALYIDHMDDVTIIPEGVYPIQAATSPITLNTVNASPGIAVGGGPIPSFFSEMEYIGNDLYYKDGRGYFLVDGTVTAKKVDGQLQLDIDAINSYELSVKLHYLGKLTSAIEDVEITPSMSVQKQIINGQLVIIRNGEIYNVTGIKL